MSDIVSTARTARESLARGLNALQSDPMVPPHFLDLAAPIAQAMGALHAIERSNGVQLLPYAEVALSNTRMALSQLQAQPPTHQAVMDAMEAVASSLAGVHSLNRIAAAPPAPVPPPPAPVYAPPPQPFEMQGHAPPQAGPMSPFAAAPAPPPQPGYAQSAPYAPPPQAPAPYAPPPQAPAPYAPPPYAPPPYAPPPQAPVPYAPPAQPAAAAFARDPFAAPARGVDVNVRGAGPAQASSLRPPSPPAPQDAHIVNADLGTHSPTNFYKGLSGNDIIEHGGLFISTYMIPPLGTPIRLKISLPGGYEFEANAVVRWAREPTDDNSAPPGFGAQFTGITPEARQLVYRYTRNREPLFHDDL